LGAVATYTKTGLVTNTAYDFSVTAHKDNSVSEMPPKITVTTLLTEVTDLTASEIRDVQMTVTWTKKTGATNYKVYHKLTSVTEWTESVLLGDVNSYTITGLTDSTTYKIAVSASNSAGSSAVSSAVSMTTYGPPVVPTAPTGLSEYSKTDEQITVRWTKVSSATKYTVHHKLTSSSEWINSAEQGDVNTFTITGLTASISYHVAVTATNYYSSSSKSSSITVTTAAVLTNQVSVLTSTQKSNNHISIIWMKLAGANSYFV
jgi:chitinase